MGCKICVRINSYVTGGSFGRCRYRFESEAGICGKVCLIGRGAGCRGLGGRIVETLGRTGVLFSGVAGGRIFVGVVLDKALRGRARVPVVRCRAYGLLTSVKCCGRVCRCMGTQSNRCFGSLARRVRGVVWVFW